MYGSYTIASTLYSNTSRTLGFVRDIDHPIDNPFSPHDAGQANMAQSKSNLFFASRAFEYSPKINMIIPREDTTPACPCE